MTGGTAAPSPHGCHPSDTDTKSSKLLLGIAYHADMLRLSDLSVAEPIGKREYRERVRELRAGLLGAQVALRDRPASALLVVAGMDGGGKGDTVRILNAWMDPRWIRTHGFDEPSEEETDRPAFWRYWRRLPPLGEIAIFLSAWYSNLLQAQLDGQTHEPLSSSLERVRSYERTLADHGMLVFKLWLHLDSEAQAERFRALEADPQRSWRVTSDDWDRWRRNDELSAAAEQMIRETHGDGCEWHLVEASDDRRRALEVGDALLSALRDHVEGDEREAGGSEAGPSAEVSFSLAPCATQEEIPKQVYRDKLGELQGQLNALHREARRSGIPVIGVFEGRDAAGKGGAIRRVVAALDARTVDVARIGPPNPEELTHHYLWRFWRRVPRAGYVTLFDRSWYGRVLAERVEELATPEEWRRAYDEINDFELQLVEHGVVLHKIWLQIDRDEQKRRFEERKSVPHKRWKLTEDDRRNRKLWKEYDEAIADMFAHTSTDFAPWTIVPANDKRHARLVVLETFVDGLQEALEIRGGVSLA